MLTGANSIYANRKITSILVTGVSSKIRNHLLLFYRAGEGGFAVGVEEDIRKHLLNKVNIYE